MLAIHIKLSMACHRKAIIDTFKLLDKTIASRKKKLEIAHTENNHQNITVLNEAIERLQKKYEDEEEEQKIMNKITQKEYLIKYPEKVQRMKDMFGDFV